MKIQTVGNILKERRESRNLSLDLLAERTMIRKDYLQYLEKDQFDKLPAASFVKGFIKSYARVLGFDHQPLLALLRRDYKESARGQLVAREFLQPIVKRRGWSIAGFLITLVAVSFLMVFAYVLWQWYQYNQPPPIQLSTPQEGEFVSPQLSVVGLTVPEAVVFINSQPVTIAYDGSFSYQLNLPHEGISTIVIEATDKKGKTRTIARTVYVKF